MKNLCRSFGMGERLRYTVLAVKPREVIDCDFSAVLKHNEILAFVIFKCSLRVVCEWDHHSVYLLT